MKIVGIYLPKPVFTHLLTQVWKHYKIILMWRRRRKRSYLPHTIIDDLRLLLLFLLWAIFFHFKTNSPYQPLVVCGQSFVKAILWSLTSWIWFVTYGESRNCYNAIFLLQAFLKMETFLADVFKPWLSRLQFDGYYWGEHGKPNATF
jgi:hypothetical protein